ncbi:MAG: hypothetical protein HZC38_16865 [Chloroflexi bacterium]|nr:hypothetical protein [Chloroflexota bacterium]MBI5715071.1 hypothetical protein [Chloroflexota bacterium]
MSILSSAPTNKTTPFASKRLEGNTQRRGVWLPKLDGELLALGLMTLTFNAFMIYVVVFRLNLFLTDAMARTRSAWQVFFSAEPKLAYIGFIWAPLPTILQLPFVLIPWLRYKGLSGNVVTALCGAGAAMVLMLLLRRVEIPNVLRWLFVGVFIFNPIIAFYSSNGMSEMVLILCVLIVAYCYVRWHETRGQWTYLTGCSIAASFAFLARYDAAFFIVILTLAVALQAFVWYSETPYITESTILMFGAPIGYVMFLWILSNWIIMGDPLFFARSTYSNAGQIGYQLTLLPWLLPIKGNLAASLQAGLIQTWSLFPPFIVLSIVTGVVIIWKRSWLWLSLLGVAWSLTLFSIMNLYVGQSALFLRYFITCIPMSYVLAVGILQSITRLRGWVSLLLILLFAVSTVSTLDAMRGADRVSNWGQWNDVFINAVLEDKPVKAWAEEEELASYIIKNTKGKILVDDFQGYRIIFFSAQPDRFITPGDSVFSLYLREPYGNVEYILTSRFELEGTLNQVNIAYPNLYSQGASWAKLDKEVDIANLVKLEREVLVWKLYRVISSPNQVPFRSPSSDVSPTK